MIDAATRAAFLAIADVLIPEAEGMPAASQVGVGDALERLLGLRPDLVESFRRGITACAGGDPRLSAERLNREDPQALSAIGLIAAAAYYMAPRVRELIGYPGQESRPASPSETPPYVANGMLRVVTDRGPIYRPTPKR
ncbi:MAG: hypothetical protein ACREFP_07550 [Acetobacteraceae bacterium]